MKNKNFENLSTPAKKVALAKDVIAQVEQKRINSTAGVYCRSTDSTGGNKPLKQFGSDEGDYCTCCAKGALFVSHFNLGDSENWKYKSLDLAEYEFVGYEIRGPMADIFSEDEWDLIEASFERSPDYASYEADKDLVEAAVNFGQRHADDEDRMIAIMENIIENNGKFCPMKTKTKV